MREQIPERFREALEMAERAHRGQNRKSNPGNTAESTPYIEHPIAVARLVLEHGGTDDEVIAALLHDAVEDGGGLEMLEEIRSRFGDAVARMVRECSDSVVDTTQGADKGPWLPRKERFLREMASASEGALLVKAADRHHNNVDCVEVFAVAGEKLWSIFNTGDEDDLAERRRKTIWFSCESLRVLEEREISRLEPMLVLLRQSTGALSMLGEAELGEAEPGDN